MLTDTACKNAHRGDKAKLGKAFKLADEKGLFLLLKPGIKGWAKWWRFKYRHGGNEKGLSFGTYPDVSLDQARQRRDDARKLLADGVDPGENRKAVKETKSALAANSFEVIAREWGQKKVDTWDDKSNRSKRMLERNIFPWLGNKPITDILPKHSRGSNGKQATKSRFGNNRQDTQRQPTGLGGLIPIVRQMGCLPNLVMCFNTLILVRKTHPTLTT